jgi:hypothetical protein
VYVLFERVADARSGRSAVRQWDQDVTAIETTTPRKHPPPSQQGARDGIARVFDNVDDSWIDRSSQRRVDVRGRDVSQYFMHDIVHHLRRPPDAAGRDRPRRRSRYSAWWSRQSTLELDGTTLLSRVLEAVTGAAQIVVVGEADAPGAISSREEPRFAGPAAAVAAGLPVRLRQSRCSTL